MCGGNRDDAANVRPCEWPPRSLLGAGNFDLYEVRIASGRRETGPTVGSRPMVRHQSPDPSQTRNYRHMDATTTVSVAGLITTLLGALAAPLIQGRMTAKNASAARVQEQREAAYADAILYAQIIEERLNDLQEDPLTRSERKRPPTPDDLLIRARLFLVAPDAVTTAFGQLITAWDNLSWTLSETGPTGPYGMFEASSDDPNVQKVGAALESLKSTLRPKP
jgi:hypothetical protein